MTTDNLRRELDRIADSAPSIDLPDDTWTRARRSVVRDRVAVGGAAFAVTAAIAAGVTWLPDRAQPPVVSPDEQIGVPDDIGLPDESALVPLGGWTFPDGAAAALLTDTGKPVLLDARDGGYDELHIEGFNPNGRVGFDLSPDGRQLAHIWNADGFYRPNGLIVQDLVTGDSRGFELSTPGGAPVFTYDVYWSPNGRWLVWDGIGRDKPDAGKDVAGRIDVENMRMVAVPVTEEKSTFAVGNDGTVVIATMDEVVTWKGKVLSTEARPADSWYPTNVAVDGRVLVETIQEERSDEMLDLTTSHRLASGKVIAAWQDLTIEPLGHLSDGSLVASVGPFLQPATRLDILDTETGEVRTVGHLDGAVRSVAVDLMSPDQPTIPTPDRPDGSTGWFGIGVAELIALGVVATAVLLALRWLWRRRRAHVTRS